MIAIMCLRKKYIPMMHMSTNTPTQNAIRIRLDRVPEEPLLALARRGHRSGRVEALRSARLRRRGDKVVRPQRTQQARAAGHRLEVEVLELALELLAIEALLNKRLGLSGPAADLLRRCLLERDGSED